jgi:leucyl-tRNA synthetase
MDVKDIEQKWQKKWDDSKIFQAKAISNKDKFFINNPYPYISGSLHIGHARVVTETDVLARFQRMNGKNTLYPIAFHISGTPVLGISLAIKNNDKEKIDIYKNYVRTYIQDENEITKIVKTFENPEKIVEFFIPKMIDEYKTLGLGVDWRRSFTSGDEEHQALVEWQFRKYKEKNYLVQGKYPILFSKTLNNAVGEDDIIDGDTKPVELQEFTLIKFKFEDSFILAGTLRPETMFGQTNMWANPNINYVKAKVNNEFWIVSKECAEKLKYQDKKVEIISEIKGIDLVGKKCFAPFIEREIPILPSLHCDANISTGLVTSVPSDAPFDYIALKELQDDEKLCKKYNLNHNDIKNIKLIPIIKSKGYGDFPAVEICKKLNITSLNQHEKLNEATNEIYKIGFHTGIMMDTCGSFSGLPVTKAKEDMKTKLLKEKKADVFYETSRIAKSRDEGEVIVAILDGQWFLDFNSKGWKEISKKCLDKIELWPEKYRKQFVDVFDWLDKRPCARRRGLGTKLPFDKEWVIESLSDSTIYMTLYPIIHLIRQNNISKEQLNKEFFDYVFNSIGKVEEVSTKTKINVELLKEMNEEFDYWYPFNQRHTFSAHLSNHLSFMIFAHTACFEEKRWPKRISFHGVVLSEGDKMSKSKGNVITLVDIKNKFGADSFRAFICNSTSVESGFNWDSDKVISMKKHLESLYEIIFEIQNNKEKNNDYLKFKSFVSRTEKAILKSSEYLEKMNLREYSNIVLFEMLNNYKKVKKIASEEEIKGINNYVSNIWIKMLTPLIPHMAEELWNMHNKKIDFVSLSEWPKYNSKLIDEESEYEDEFYDKLRKDILSVIELTKIQNPKKIKLFVSLDWKYDFVKFMKEEFEQTKDVKEIISKAMSTKLKENGNEVIKLIPAMIKDTSKIPKILKNKKEEFIAVDKIKNFIQDEFKASVEIVDANKSNEPKAKNAMPGKPAILIE